jgi:hypothetical protein
MGALYPGSIFLGTQSASEDEKTYPVEVKIQNVDLIDSTLCGYLTISNLTPICPSLTTFFEAEVVGAKYSFRTGKWVKLTCYIRLLIEL